MHTKTSTITEYFNNMKNGHLFIFHNLFKRLTERGVVITIPSDGHNSLFEQSLERHRQSFTDMLIGSKYCSVQIMFKASLDDNKDLIRLKFNWSENNEDDYSLTELIPLSALDDDGVIDSLALSMKGELSDDEEVRTGFLKRFNTFGKPVPVEVVK